MKKSKLMIALLMVGTTAVAQTLQDAIKLTLNEQFNSADAMFKNLSNAQPNNGDVYFYWGENYFRNDNAEMANQMYQKGVEVNATNALPYVGLGKVLWYKGKEADAKASFFKATTLGAGKNAAVLKRIAEAYINAPTKNLTDAFTLLAQANKLDPKDAEAYLLTGDAYMEQNNGGKAAENYEKVNSLNPKDIMGLLRQGQLYSRAKNYNLSLDFYRKAKAIDSTFAPAFREAADIYILAGKYGEAVYNMKKYLALNNDCSAKSKYSGVLNRAKMYKESIEAGKEALNCPPPVNPYTYRYLAYSMYETADYTGGIENINLLFSTAAADKIIGLDYEYRAKLLSKTGKDSLAILDYQKAMEMQPEKYELYGDMAKAYINMKKYAEAIDSYKTKMSKSKPGATDYQGLIRAYYQSKDFVNSDSAAVQFIKLQPEMWFGYISRARANVQMDPKNEKWLAKEHYEMYLTKVKPEEKEKEKKNMIEAYRYLAAYYADKSRNDCPNVKLYMQKILELDPANADAKKILAGLKC